MAKPANRFWRSTRDVSLQERTKTIDLNLVDRRGVAEVNPDLVGARREGRDYTVRYDAVNAMLLNDSERTSQVREQQATITELQIYTGQPADDFQRLSRTAKANRSA